MDTCHSIRHHKNHETKKITWGQEGECGPLIARILHQNISFYLLDRSDSTCLCFVLLLEMSFKDSSSGKFRHQVVIASRAT